MKNVIVIVLDSVGMGALPDAEDYGDQKAATLLHTLNEHPNPHLPNLEKLGLGKIMPLKGIKSDIKTIGAYGKLASQTKGKDAITGHWELMGMILEKPFSIFTKNGFPKEILDEFTKRTGYGFLGNIAENGEEILKKYGKDHLKTKKLIVYTSKESVCEIAAHVDVIDHEELYRICEEIRTICNKYLIEKVIARPFITSKDGFVESKNRKDFFIKPFEKTALNYLMDKNITTIGIGIINDIFVGYGLKKKIHSHGNKNCIESTIDEMKKNKKSFIFTNLLDFDLIYGHKRDVLGYYNCLKEFDKSLPQIYESLDKDDLLIITADHGNDPTFKGNDHTREYAPLLAYQKTMKKAINLNIGSTFADVGKTALDYYKIKAPLPGRSFLKMLNEL